MLGITHAWVKGLASCAYEAVARRKIPMENSVAMKMRQTTKNIFAHDSSPIRFQRNETCTFAFDQVPQVSIEKMAAKARS